MTAKGKHTALWKRLSAKFPLPSADCCIWQFNINPSKNNVIRLLQVSQLVGAIVPLHGHVKTIQNK